MEKSNEQRPTTSSLSSTSTSSLNNNSAPTSPLSSSSLKKTLKKRYDGNSHPKNGDRVSIHSVDIEPLVDEFDGEGTTATSATVPTSSISNNRRAVSRKGSSSTSSTTSSSNNNNNDNGAGASVTMPITVPGGYKIESTTTGTTSSSSSSPPVTLPSSSNTYNTPSSAYGNCTFTTPPSSYAEGNVGGGSTGRGSSSSSTTTLSSAALNKQAAFFGGGGGTSTSSSCDMETSSTAPTELSVGDRHHHHHHYENQSSTTSNNTPSASALVKRRKINLLIDQCESVRFPFRKKLILANMNLTSNDIPVDDICGSSSSMCSSLYKLSLAGNKLGSLNGPLVVRLSGLRTLELSQCDLKSVPEKWDLPHLKRLDLSHNCLDEFLNENALEGLPELQHLDMYGNKVRSITIPRNSDRLLSKLDHLNLGYNALSSLPIRLCTLKSLRTLKVMNNVLEIIPMEVCDMDLRVLDVSSNPLIQPPTETCERGICSMRRYYACLKVEEDTRQKMLAQVQKKVDVVGGGGGNGGMVGGVGQTTSVASGGNSNNMMGNDAPVVTLGGGVGVPLNTGITEKTSSKKRGVKSKIMKKLKPRRGGSTANRDDDSSVMSGNTLTDLNRAKSAPTESMMRLRRGKTLVKKIPPTTKKILESAVATMGSPAAVTNEGVHHPDALSSKNRSSSMPHPTTAKVSPKQHQDQREERKQHTEEEEENSQQSPPPSTSSIDTTNTTTTPPPIPPPEDQITRNDTLKVIFVGMAYAGKTSMIKRLIEGPHAIIPKEEERTIGVDIYEWDPTVYNHEDRNHISTDILLDDGSSGGQDQNIKFSVWDFAGQHVYHATHELFFSRCALYVLCWDMGATNRDTQQRHRRRCRRRKKRCEVDNCERGAFRLTYDSDEDDDEDDEEKMLFRSEDEIRKADRALERDVDEKVQFWVDCIQSSAPGAAILPVATFDDYFLDEDEEENDDDEEDEDKDGGWGREEALRRCRIMKDRLWMHEERRKKGLQERLEEFTKGRKANSAAALRLQHLLCPYYRPKLIFGEDENDAVVRVSGLKYTGFDRLSEKIINIATGRDKGGWEYPVFRGHVGARIPRMRLEVRDVVRQMRDRFKVVEWGYFLETLKEKGLDRGDYVNDALHFLTNVGELSYFGDVDLDDRKDDGPTDIRCGSTTKQPPPSILDDDLDEDDDALLPMDQQPTRTTTITSNTSTTTLTTETTTSLSSITTTPPPTSLSQFVFLNPRWLVTAVACILRHDLSREINETRRMFDKRTTHPTLDHSALRVGCNSFYDVHLNCPVITAEDARMLWQAKKITKKAAERAQEYSGSGGAGMSPFDFLQRLLARFGVFVPIDLGIDKALLGGKEYKVGNVDESIPDGVSFRLGSDEEEEEQEEQNKDSTPHFFFLPSLLGPGKPSEAWTYKNSDSWKITLCHSLLFPDGVPPGLMERITAAVLTDIYSATHSQEHNNNNNQPCDDGTINNNQPPHHTNKLRVKEILCWRSAFYLKLGMEVHSENEIRESLVEIFTHLADRDSTLCVASDLMGVGMRRLIVSGKGQVGEGGRKIWQGGYALVIRAVVRVAEEYGGLEVEKQAVCPECLSRRPVSQASTWEWMLVHGAARRGDTTMRCHCGHRVDTRLVAGMCVESKKKKKDVVDGGGVVAEEGEEVDEGGRETIVPVSDLLRGVVVVGLWDAKIRKVIRVGSGFVVDRKRGLIVTASHTLMNVWGEEGGAFGENYYGMRDGKVVIGVIPRCKGVDRMMDGTTAVFRYFAKIVAKDENIENNRICKMDACVLQITTKMERDVGGDGDECGDQPEILLLNNHDAMKKEKLHQLKVSTKHCELDEQVRILGYNQGGEGLMNPGMHVNRCVDFARGYVVMKFHNNLITTTTPTTTDKEQPQSQPQHEQQQQQHRPIRRFQPKEEIVVMCSTIGGHSGGPCVNQAGEVIGILSRADPAERQRCYLVPASEWRGLVKRAKNSFF